MKCQKCKTSHPAGVNVCWKCGALLGGRDGWEDGRRWLMALFCLLLLGWTGYLCRGMLFPFYSTEVKSVEEKKRARPRVEVVEPFVTEYDGGQAKNGTKAPLLEISQKEEKKTAFPVGWVTIYDHWHNEIASIDSLVVDGNWVALPVRACLGGVRFIFHLSSSGESFEIFSGQWAAGDEVALWRLALPHAVESPSLAAWQHLEESHWRSLVSLRASGAIALHADWQQGAFLHAPLPVAITESGVIVQHDRVTGWTFGDWLDGAYMWQQENNHSIEITVDAFYEATFAGGREEQFVRALTLDEGAGEVERLQVFLQGFQLPPKLDLEDVPESLYPENILAEVRDLAWHVQQQGLLDELTQLVDGEMIRAVADFALLKIVVEAWVATGGYGHGLDLVKQALAVFEASEEADNVRALQLELYQLWLEALVADGELEAAWRVLEKGTVDLAESLELHLLRVSLVLASGDWQMAEELLAEREYPSFLSRRVGELADSISEMKGQEEKVVVHFSPGSNHIPVEVQVNGAGELPFLVDTGASLVSLPLSFLPELGLEINTSTPRRKVVTAAGWQEAWLVTLDAIELAGWEVKNLEALVVDTGGQNDFGLLGLNFLNKFHLQLDSNKGVLILTPR